MKVNIGPSYDTLDNGIYVYEQRNNEMAVLFMNSDTYQYLICGIDYMSKITDSSFNLDNEFDTAFKFNNENDTIDKMSISGIYKGRKIFIDQDLNFGEIDVR